MTEAPSNAHDEARSRARLRKVARYFGVQASYTDFQNKTKWASTDTLLRLISNITNQPITNVVEAETAFAAAVTERLRWPLDPVLLCSENTEILSVNVLVAHSRFLAKNSFFFTVALGASEQFEGEGTQFQFQISPSDCVKTRGIKKFSGETYAKLSFDLRLPEPLPIGYHRLTIKSDLPAILQNSEQQALIICSPDKIDTKRVTKKGDLPEWGLITPTYALRSQNDWGIGGMCELAMAQDWLAKVGGSTMGTLPLLATASGEKNGDPSPYSPLTRLFWNEIYLDVAALVAEEANSKASALVNSQAFQEELKKLRSQTSVNYEKVWQLKNRVLEILSEDFFKSGGADSSAFRSFLQVAPQAPDYANFRSGELAGDANVFLYAQFQLHRALSQMALQARQGEAAGLFLDFPVGVANRGFDSQQYADSFLAKTSAGAPPDLFSEHGQGWGFYPFHPKNLRESGYDYFIRSLRAHMQFATVIRLDHVMGLHRMFAIPDGVKVRDGTYLRYRPEELYAILRIEGTRMGCNVVGEDLGTVAPVVRRSMAESGLNRLWVLQLELLGEDVAQALKNALLPPPQSLVCINTHDLIPFAGFLKGADIKLLAQLKFLSESGAQKITEHRMAAFKDIRKQLGLPESETATLAILTALITRISDSPAHYLLLNVEDLWGEERPQNVPGTQNEYPNWRLRHQVPIEDWLKLEGISKILLVLANRHNKESEYEI